MPVEMILEATCIFVGHLVQQETQLGRFGSLINVLKYRIWVKAKVTA